MTGTLPLDIPIDLLVAVNRAAVVGTAARWLMHDIRTPLQAVTLVTELLGAPGDPPDPVLVASLADGGRDLARGAERLDRLLRPLPLAREPGPIVLADAARQVADLHGTERGGIELSLDEAALGRLPAARGVEEVATHVLLALLLNARAALADRDAGRVTITAETRDGLATLVVEDDGPGLPAALGERIFEPFVSTRPPSALVGLGLPVGRHLLGLYGGTVTAEAAAGGGARVVMGVPVW